MHGHLHQNAKGETWSNFGEPAHTAHPAAPAVPQPVDREALRDLLAWCRSEEEIRGLDDPYDWRSQGEASMLRVIGAKLQAVLAGEQEQVER